MSDEQPKVDTMEDIQIVNFADAKPKKKKKKVDKKSKTEKAAVEGEAGQKTE